MFHDILHISFKRIIELIFIVHNRFRLVKLLKLLILEKGVQIVMVTMIAYFFDKLIGLYFCKWSSFIEKKTNICYIFIESKIHEPIRRHSIYIIYLAEFTKDSSTEDDNISLILLWAIFANRKELAEIYWLRGKNHLCKFMLSCIW